MVAAVAIATRAARQRFRRGRRVVAVEVLIGLAATEEAVGDEMSGT